LGRGLIRGAHGKIPLPAPATLALLEGVPVVGSDLMTETITPTGAVILTSLAADFAPIPKMKLLAIGYGAGGRDLPIPNILRVLVGEAEKSQSTLSENLILLESNIDDLNPEIYAFVMETLFLADALDVYLTPIQMKKNRPGTQLSVLCREKDATKIRNILFIETSTLGIREFNFKRHYLNRQLKLVETPWGNVNIKIADLSNGEKKFSPEYEDCRQIALQQGIALRDVYYNVIKLAQAES
jgi:uncharacterized protein (TIGR00299 family) protein